MKPTDIIKYLVEIININTENPLILEDMLEELKSIYDLAQFRIYIKTNFTKEKYKYYNGYQKFLALKNDFEKENKPKLNAEQRFKAENYSDKLFSKTTDCFEWINWELQTGTDLHDQKINYRLFLVFGKNEKDLKVLEQIGKRADILRLYRSNKGLLKDKINEIVANLTLRKEYPQLAYENKEQQVIARLKRGA